MLNLVYISVNSTKLITNSSIIVTDVSLCHINAASVSPIAAILYESDNITKICRVQCKAVFSSHFDIESKNHAFQLTTPFLAPRGLFVRFPGAGSGSVTITYMNVGA